MEDRKLIMAVAAIAIVAILASAGAIVMATMPDNADDGEDVYMLYVGFGDKTDEEISDIDTEIKNKITNDFKLGYTAYEASGAAVSDGSVIVDRITMVYMLTFTDGDTVKSVADWIQDKYGFVILLEKYTSEELTLLLP